MNSKIKYIGRLCLLGALVTGSLPGLSSDGRSAEILTAMRIHSPITIDGMTAEASRVFLRQRGARRQKKYSGDRE